MTKQDWEKAKSRDIILCDKEPRYKIISLTETTATVEILTKTSDNIRIWNKSEWSADHWILQSILPINRVNLIEID